MKFPPFTKPRLFERSTSSEDNAKIDNIDSRPRIVTKLHPVQELDAEFVATGGHHFDGHLSSPSSYNSSDYPHTPTSEMVFAPAPSNLSRPTQLPASGNVATLEAGSHTVIPHQSKGISRYFLIYVLLVLPGNPTHGGTTTIWSTIDSEPPSLGTPTVVSINGQQFVVVVIQEVILDNIPTFIQIPSKKHRSSKSSSSSSSKDKSTHTLPIPPPGNQQVTPTPSEWSGVSKDVTEIDYQPSHMDGRENPCLHNADERSSIQFPPTHKHPFRAASSAGLTSDALLAHDETYTEEQIAWAKQTLFQLHHQQQTSNHSPSSPKDTAHIVKALVSLSSFKTNPSSVAPSFQTNPPSKGEALDGLGWLSAKEIPRVVSSVVSDNSTVYDTGAQPWVQRFGKMPFGFPMTPESIQKWESA
ncbi:hypothetical protein DL96DRAFT_808698 [Flagelloscypha sp. PMI_526]|nr:hypothetical protein DL96DRAFT_808698 [Flagelloscypha sp. PMI_526]